MEDALNPMFAPLSPGNFINVTYLGPQNLSIRALAAACGVAVSTMARLIASDSRVTPETALRLEKVLGRSAKSWLTMQDNYDLWKARTEFDFSNLESLHPIAA
jgi:addiction module HigA family antidote